MSEPIRVLEIANNWGIGGTELAFQTRVQHLNREFFSPMAVGFESGGPRLDILAKQGIPTVDIALNYETYERLIAEFRPHILHFLRVNTLNAMIARTQGLAKKHGVSVEVETNVFGRPGLDPGLEPPALVGHMSQSSMLRCAALAGKPIGDLFTQGHRAIFNPIPTDAFREFEMTPKHREVYRAGLGVMPGELLAIRVGRADLRKWSVRLEMAIPKVLAAVPNLKYAFRSAPPERFARLQKYGKARVILLPETSELGELAKFYQACDFMVHSSAIGESFGCSMAEAMFWRKPVIVDSTPEMDNAQVEVVDHGETGFVVRSVSGFVEAVKRLSYDAEMRLRMGEAGHRKAMAAYSERAVVRTWEKHYIGALDRAGCPVITERHREYAAAIPPLPGVNESEFAAEYAARCGRFLGPVPSLGERAKLGLAHAKGIFGFARRVGVKRVWIVVKDRLKAGRLFRRA